MKDKLSNLSRYKLLIIDGLDKYKVQQRHSDILTVNWIPPSVTLILFIKNKIIILERDRNHNEIEKSNINQI